MNRGEAVCVGRVVANTGARLSVALVRREWREWETGWREWRERRACPTQWVLGPAHSAVDGMGDHHEEDKDEYKVPTKVGLNDLLERDKDDAALESYKKQLLGTAHFSRTSLSCVCVCSLSPSMRAVSRPMSVCSWPLFGVI